MGVRWTVDVNNFPQAEVKTMDKLASSGAKTKVEADERLRVAYLNLWPRLEAVVQPLLADGVVVSKPHLILCTVFEGYFQAACKLLVVGQQTNGWFGRFGDWQDRPKEAYLDGGVRSIDHVTALMNANAKL